MPRALTSVIRIRMDSGGVLVPVGRTGTPRTPSEGHHPHAVKLRLPGLRMLVALSRAGNHVGIARADSAATRDPARTILATFGL